MAPVAATTSSKIAVQLGQLGGRSGTTEASIVPSTTPKSSRVQIEPIETWNGIIAVRERQIIIPQDYSSYTWVADFSKCAEFETGLKDTLRTINTTANAETDNDKKSRLKLFVTDEREDLQRSNLKSIEDQLEEKVAKIPHNQTSTCEEITSPPLGQEICGDLLADLTLLQDNLVESLSIEQESSRNGGLASIMNLHRAYQEQLEEFKLVLSSLKQGEVPRQLLPLFEAGCNLLFQQCKEPPSASMYLKINSKLSRALEYGKMPNEHKTFLTIGAPCMDTAEKITQYKLIPVPYKQEGKIVKATIPDANSHVWFKHNPSGSHIAIREPWGCIPIDYAITVCPPQKLTIISQTEKFTLSSVPSAQYKDTKNIELIEGPLDGIIVAAQDTVSVAVKCADNEEENHNIKGINHIVADETCKIKIHGEAVNIGHLPSALQNLANGIADILTAGENDFLLRNGAQLANDILPQLIDIADVTLHFEKHWFYYAWVTTLLLVGGFTILAYRSCNTVKQKRIRTRIQRKRSRTYVLPREMVTSA
jgi:hypothetical protein